ncbi:MAG: VCBS repeat-containing protein [Fuerstia sp.]|nr:VCBS repeat-containing protein [Fuerstiella sp.]
MNSRIVLRRILPVVVAVITVISVVWIRRGPDVESAQRDVRRLYQRGDYELAEQAASLLLDRDPGLEEVRFMAADSAAHTGNNKRAMEHLSLLKSTQHETALKASLQMADLAHYRIFDLRGAESAYRSALQLDPDNVQAHEGLIRLFAVCGRRREAIPLLLHLVQVGQASDLLTIAARGSGAINDPEFLQQAHAAYPNDSRALVGLAMLADRSGNSSAAIDFCRKAVAAQPDFVPAIVDVGQYLLTAESFEELDEWERNLSPACLEFAEAWRVRGYLAEHHGNLPDALSDFLEAARRGPELKDVQHRLSRLFQKAGDTDAAKVFSDRLLLIQKLETQQDRMFSAGPGDVEVLIATVAMFRDLGRLWEACGWTQMGLINLPNSAELQQLAEELNAETAGLPLELAATSANPAFRYTASSYSLPIVVPTLGDDVPGTSDTQTVFSFQDDAANVGLRFSYINGVSGPTTHRMFEFTGGGIGVCDFDHDDFPDLFFSQGGLWETRGTGADANDRLFRNVCGQGFVEVTAAGIRESQFGQGVAVGDPDGDGFSDLFVANIGQNALWINNGDGTFTDHSDRVRDTASDNTWTTSALFADLNRDGAADIYAANYLGAPDVIERICRSDDGHPKACIQVHFDCVTDSLLLNDTGGGYQNASEQLHAFDAGKGLGVIAWSAAGDGRLSVFVANDTTPNMFLNFGSGDDPVVQEQGFASGLAVNAQGKSEGCMGIAAGDLNYDGLTDLLVTNFYNESNTFYQAVDGTSFDDATASVRLAAISVPMLGFGAQFVDANLDGALELVVANGHVDDLRREGKPYQMPTQFLQFRNGAFEECRPEMLGEYFTRNHLGRSVVSLDWNVDGRPDLAIGHLSEAYALLTNTSPDPGNFVTLKLIGIKSSRDPIGASVSCRLDGRLIVRQLTAGDGYHASNQHELLLGCGSLTQIDALTLQWPSGGTQVLQNIPASGRFVVREGEGKCYSLP